MNKGQIKKLYKILSACYIVGASFALLFTTIICEFGIIATVIFQAYTHNFSVGYDCLLWFFIAAVAITWQLRNYIYEKKLPDIFHKAVYYLERVRLPL